MSKRNEKKAFKRMLHKLGITKESFTSRSGLLPLVELLEALNIKQQADALFPPPGSNRSYDNSTIVNTFVLMLNEGASCLEDVYHLHTEAELLKLLGIQELPGADTLARWLHRHGEAGVPLVGEISRRVIAETLKLLRVDRVTLDIDATAILNNKSGAMWTYLKHRGYMPIIGIIAQSGQVIAAEFRDGNVPPNFDNVGFIKQCQDQLLAAGIVVGRVRSDSAGYQKVIIEGLAHQDIEFIIRAKLDTAIKTVIASVPEADWKPLRLRDGSLSPHQWVARRPHIMHNSDTPFNLIMQCCLKSEVTDLPDQRELPGLSIETQYETDKYIYRVIATNIEGLDDSQIVHEYNQHGECAENRIKELKSDFSAGRLPCSDFGANALYISLCALAYNVFALLRAGLPTEFRFARAPTLRVRLFGLAAKIVRHGRHWMLKLHNAHYQLLKRVFEHLHSTMGGLLPEMRYPLLH